ncbi:hypothetical protein ACJMK2_029138 [Sinanodonta woodiana]|uniref:MD-2-related lipid-recognition domain-containing protein n=1 Tax=Sinanodonta woodiana TaxID=1069815 RepID=A0ABD3X988_SINWO
MRRMLVISVSLALVAVSEGFSYTTCDHVKNPIVSINSTTIHPTTLRMGENLTLAFEATVHRSITSKLRVDLTIKKKHWFGNMWIPCLFKLGSCSYEVCDLLSSIYATEGVQCPLLLDNSNVNCTCPFQPGTYKVEKETFQLPTVPAGFGLAVRGNYTVEAKLVDTTTKKVVGCYAMTVSIKA